ncbi:MAG TPA: MAPEG family protein [Caulobacteraceae bacterium]
MVMPAASIEIALLGWSVVLLLVHIAVQGAFAVRERGLSWNAGPRDDALPPTSAMAGRAARALANFKETYPAFIALALALAVTGRAGGVGETGAWLWFGARIVYLPLYILGVPWLRTLAYGASLVGLIMMLSRVLGG